MKKFLLSLLWLLLLSHNLFAATEFISKICATGSGCTDEDYNSLSTWEAVMDDAGDITAATVKVFSHGGITGTVGDLASVTGQTSSATGTVVHCDTTQILIKSITGTFQSGEEVRVTAGNSVTISNAGADAIITAEVYDNDGAIDGSFSIDGFTTNSTNYVKITAPVGERHAGVASSGAKLTATSTGDYGTCFGINDNYTVIEWLSLGCTFTHNEVGGILSGTGHNGSIVRNSLVYRVSGAGSPGWIFYSIATGTTTVNNSIIYDGSTNINGSRVYDGALAFNNATFYGNANGPRCESSTTTLKNVISYGNTGDDYLWSWSCHSSSTHNLSEDDTAPGTTNYPSKTLTFFNTSGDDYHLVSGDTDAIDKGTDLGTTYQSDIDNYTRTGTWDLGADEFVAATTRRIMLISENKEAECYSDDWYAPQEAGKCKIGNSWYPRSELNL